MRVADLRRFCLSLPGAAESVQWGNAHVYKVGGKMFVVLGLEGRIFRRLSFKASPESRHILIREPGIVPAPYLARAGWIALDRLDRLPADQLRAYIARSHTLVVAALPKKLRQQFGG